MGRKVCIDEEDVFIDEMRVVQACRERVHAQRRVQRGRKYIEMSVFLVYVAAGGFRRCCCYKRCAYPCTVANH